MENSQTPETTPVKAEKRSRLSSGQRDFLKGKHAVSNSVTVLVLVIYALLLLSRLVDAAFLSRESQYLSIILLQLMIFPIPAYLYVRMRNVDPVKHLRLTRIKLSHLFLLLSASLMLITGCTLLAMLGGMM